MESAALCRAFFLPIYLRPVVFQVFKLVFTLEWRRRDALLSVALYVLTSVYLSYLVLEGSATAQMWNALFWIIFIFAAVQAAFRSFQNEASRRFLLYYQMIKPQALVLGKSLYNFFYLFLIGILNLLIFSFLFKNPIEDLAAFLLIILLASAGFSAILTFTAGISAKAGDNPALPAILSIPLLFPQVIALSKVSGRAVTGFSWGVNAQFIIVLSLLVLVSALLGYLLFAYLWRD